MSIVYSGSAVARAVPPEQRLRHWVLVQLTLIASEYIRNKLDKELRVFYALLSPGLKRDYKYYFDTKEFPCYLGEIMTKMTI